MSFKDCIKKQLGDFQVEGFVTEGQAKKLYEEYESLLEKYKDNFQNPADAEAAAARAIDIKQNQLVDEAKAKVKHAISQKRLTENIKENVLKKQQQYKAATKAAQKAMRTPSVHHEIADLYESIATRQKTISRTMMVRMFDFYQEYGSKWLGFVQNHKEIPNVVKAITGDDVANPMARKAGEAIREVFDDLHKRYEQAGGSIGKIVNYFPQTHNPEKIKKISLDEWTEYLMRDGVLDRENMIDYDTGLPMTDERLIKQIADDYEGITSYGLSEVARRVEEGKQTRGFGRDVFKRRQQSRFYKFANADEFLKYNELYGVGQQGLFDAIGGHIHSMSRDIALMEKLGPKPHAVARYFDLFMESEGIGANKRKFVNGMYNLESGRLSEYGTLPLAYRFVEGSKAIARNLLGGAALSAVADTAFIHGAARANGYSSWRTLKKYFAGANPLDKQTQRSMARFVSVQQGLLGMSLESARFTDAVGYDGGKVVQTLGFMTNALLRASGLTRLTDQGKMATMAAMYGEFAEYVTNKTPYSQLNKNMKDTLEKFNISEKDYNIILKSNLFKDPETGADFLIGDNIAEIKGIKLEDRIRIAANYEDMATRMGEMATNEPTLRTRAATSGAAFAPEDAQIGSTYRSVVGAFMTFKGFPITVMQNFTFPMIRKALNLNVADIIDLTTVLGMGTIIGGMVVQAKLIAKGEEARDMDDPKFWMAAAMQGGGMGILGDFLFQDMSRFNQSFVVTLAGPVTGMYSDGLKILNANFNRAIDKKDETKFALDAYNFVNRYIPGTTLWYARLPIERVMLDSIEEALDPNFDRRVKRKERQMLKDEGRGYWWRPGDVLP